MAEAPHRMESDIETLLRLLNQLEFEGKQYAAELEKENQMIAQLESSTASAKETVRLNEEAIKRMKEEEKLMDAQYHQNMQSCNSLQEACDILSEKEKSLQKELEDVRRKGKAERERHETMIKNYNDKYESYKKTYENSKLALIVKQKEEEFQRLEKEYAEEKKKTMETEEKLERAKRALGRTTDGDVDFPVFNNLNDFIVRLAQMKFIYDASVMELEYKTRRCEELKSSIQQNKEAKIRREAEQKQQEKAINRQKEFVKLGSQRNEEKTKDFGNEQIKEYERQLEKVRQKGNTLQHEPSSTGNRDQVMTLKSEVLPVPKFHARAPPQILMPMRQSSVTAQQRTPMKSLDAVARKPTQHFKVPLVPIQFQLSTAKDSEKSISTNAPLLIGSLKNQDQMEEAIGPKTHQVDDVTVPVFQNKIYSQMYQNHDSDHQQSNVEKVPPAILSEKVQQKNEADDTMMSVDTGDYGCSLKTAVISYERPTEILSMDLASANGESLNEMSETSQQKLPEPSQQKMLEVSRWKLPEASQLKLPEASRLKLSEASQQKMSEVSQQKMPETSQQKMLKVSQWKLPETSQEKMLEAGQQKLPEASEQKLPEASLQSFEVAAMHSTVLQKLSLGLDCESGVNKADDDLLVRMQFPVVSISPPPEAEGPAAASSTSYGELQSPAPDEMPSVAPSMIATDDCQSDAMDTASQNFSDCHFQTPEWVESPLSDDYQDGVEEPETEPGPFAGDVITSPPQAFNFEEEMRRLKELAEAKTPDSYLFSSRRMFSGEDQSAAGEESSAKVEKSKPVGDLGQPESGGDPALLEFNLDALFGFRAVEPTHDVCKAFAKGGSDADSGAASRSEHGRDKPPSGAGIFKMFPSDAADRGPSSADGVFKMFGSKGDGDSGRVRPQDSGFFKMFDIGGGGARSESTEKGSDAFFSDFSRKSSAGGSQAKGRFTLF